ncbi:bifunctional isocitrate dehydrogenase kinase/phosphatase [Wenzhouxiangella sp. XN24]|uniref:bifunctional isocitrate dehydrogenase kinase/phosphatase n=1 Tax=Wenzhouxiangella sp. XN24 TaxID=2713569 RepID=UPI00197E83C2|nr:bifunctional isocitrate dehydrogenase kinase/phosphatase [Wenzhouxiangella sp. XN24]
MADPALARECARAIFDAFGDYNAEFREITRRARLRFESRDWAAGRRDATERIDLYDRYVARTTEALRGRLAGHANNRALWVQIKACFEDEIRDFIDLEFEKTFFSSISRRLFTTVGVDPEVEFVALDLDPLSKVRPPQALNVYEHTDTAAALVEDVLEDHSFESPWEDFKNSVDFVVAELVRAWEPLGGLERLTRIEFMRPIFYQNTRAYVVGRALGVAQPQPVVIALKNGPDGISVDAVLTSVRDTSILFGFTRSYFHADLETVHDAVVFLRTILPRKPLAELFTVLGRARQGKTETYRTFFRHLQHSRDQFVEAPGDRGMVMAVFTLPSFDVVFKVIRDRFAYPKTVVRKDVLDKYYLVFRHDRAGRLVDAQEFKMLRFPRTRFDPALLEHLLESTSQTVCVDGDDVVITHCYVERRLRPLNLYLAEASPLAARHAVLDYGQAIRDLAATNIFPGDLLLKNFGVTRNGRVIFYDYDELCLVTECNFRKLPKARTMEEEMQSEAWFFVDEDDVFPEQFVSFLGFEPQQLEVFMENHADLLTPEFWREMKRRHEAGEVLEILPYRPSLSAQASGG